MANLDGVTESAVIEEAVSAAALFLVIDHVTSLDSKLQRQPEKKDDRLSFML